MTLKGTARGKSIEFEDALPYPSSQELRIKVEPVTNGAPLRSATRLLKIGWRPGICSDGFIRLTVLRGHSR